MTANSDDYNEYIDGVITSVGVLYEVLKHNKKTPINMNPITVLNADRDRLVSDKKTDDERKETLASSRRKVRQALNEFSSTFGFKVYPFFVDITDNVTARIQWHKPKGYGGSVYEINYYLINDHRPRLKRWLSPAIFTVKL